MILAHSLCNTTWWICETFYYISSHKGSCWCKKRKVEKEKESRGTRLERLAKRAFLKVRGMSWDVWIHACSHRFLGCGYGIEGFHGCIVMVFLLNNTW